MKMLDSCWRRVTLLMVLPIILFIDGCAPFPSKIEQPPSELFLNHSGWICSNFPMTISQEDSQGVTMVYASKGWRRWTWKDWEAVDINLDGYPDLIEKLIREKDWNWANMYECYEDTDYDGVFDLHYYRLEDGHNYKESKVKIAAPRLGPDLRNKH